jgi:hypothetical protein
MVQVAVGASAEPPHTSSVELSRAIDSKTAAACSPAGAAYIRRPVKPDCPRGVGVYSPSVRERGLYRLELLRAALVMIRLTGKSTQAKAMPGTQTHQSSVAKPMRNNASPRIETQQIHRVHVLSRRER